MIVWPPWKGQEDSAEQLDKFKDVLAELEGKYPKQGKDGLAIFAQRELQKPSGRIGNA